MRLHRFYIQDSLSGKKEIRISHEKLLHQLRDVFRLAAGDEVIFFDGRGIDYGCKVTVLAKREGVFEKLSEEQSFIPETKVTLLMSVIKKENFELVVEKATELGVSTIVPIVTERTLIKNLNTDRLQRIMIEASEQCGRGDIPLLGEITNLELAIADYKNIIAFDISGYDLSSERIHKVLGSPREALGQTIVNSPAIEILIGPEGGWSEKELALLRDKNITLAKLGDTTLRAETAAIVACSKILYQ